MPLTALCPLKNPYIYALIPNATAFETKQQDQNELLILKYVKTDKELKKLFRKL